MRQVIKHRDIRLLNMIRRTDPVMASPEKRLRLGIAQASLALHSPRAFFDLLTQTDNNLGYPWIFGELVVSLQPWNQNNDRYGSNDIYA